MYTFYQHKYNLYFHINKQWIINTYFKILKESYNKLEDYRKKI